jgi:hypothetical protein
MGPSCWANVGVSIRQQPDCQAIAIAWSASWADSMSAEPLLGRLEILHRLARVREIHPNRLFW